MTQRVYAAALLHTGVTTIHYPGHSDDELTALNIIQQLGAEILSKTPGKIIVKSNGIDPVHTSIDCVESGLASRLFIPIAAMHNKQIEIFGSGSLLTRTMAEFGEVLPKLGVKLEGFNGYLPFKLKGPLQPENISIDGSVSSQFLSGLLFALAYSVKHPVTIEVTNLKSKPYVDLTLDILNKFGKKIEQHNYQYFQVDPSEFEERHEVEITIEPDWSSAACWLVGGATNGEITLSGLRQNSLQADKEILDVLSMAGADMQISDDDIKIASNQLGEFDFDATDCPDLFPILSVLAGKCYGESYIKGIHRLWHKESNRIESITEMLHQFGIPYSIEDDTLCIRGKMRFEYATIDSYNDHRIVMAAAIAALLAKGPVTILGAEAVNKSYPDFFKDLISLGVNCILE